MSEKVILFFIRIFAGIFGKAPIVSGLRQIAYVSRNLAAFTHRWQRLIDWTVKPVPEWYDHYLDQYYYWHKTRNPQWVERGCFNLLAFKKNAKVLDLCCGDGFNSYHFYSFNSKSVLAVDFDSQAIDFAKRCNSASNIQYRLSDIRQQFPQGKFDNVCWDAAIEHFTPEEIHTVLKKISSAIGKYGLLSGYTIQQLPGGKQHELHEYEFLSKEDLYKHLKTVFKNVRVFENNYPGRHNLYFYASQGSALPFDKSWPHSISS